MELIDSENIKKAFFVKGIISSSPLQAPIEAELRTGQAAGLFNGVKKGDHLQVEIL